MLKHNAGNGAKFTRGRGPWRVVHAEGPHTHGDALRREYQIKHDPAFKTDLKRQTGFHAQASHLPAAPGAYVLHIRLEQDTVLHLTGRPPIHLSAGRYLYCGSARGPGGIKARVGRHMRTDKTIHWHIDHLTAAGRVVGAWVYGGASECALASCLTPFPTPAPGFGSSDCPVCASHLFQWPDGREPPFL